MDGVFNTIKKCLDDIINKLNQISLFTNKTNENKSVKSVINSMNYNELKAKNGTETTIFEYNGDGYIEKIKILNFLKYGNYSGNTSLSEFKIIIDGNTFLTIDNIYCVFGVTNYINDIFNNGSYSLTKYDSDTSYMNGIDIDIPIKKIIKNNIKCVCKPIRFNDNSNSKLVCSAWIEER